MKRSHVRPSALAVVAALLLARPLASCTSILVSKGASKNAGCIITYSCDGEFHPRLRIIPAEDYPADAVVEIRGRQGLKGTIPQVAHTYKVLGLMNEFQLAIGETTFDGRLELVNPDGLLHYFQLMTLALQRAKTAREAIRVMADLVDRHGYFSSGESFSIADKEEAWIMEMIGTGKGGKGAVWVALRLPDGFISAHANMARIGEFPLDDPENCLYAPNVVSFAVERGFYDPKAGKPFSFTLAYCPPSEEQVKYSARRVWSIFRRAAPGLGLSPDFSSSVRGAKPYPLWIRPERPLGVRDVIALHRDHYEGTPFDMSRDLSAGPFAMPDRWRPIKWKVGGRAYSWERPISTQQVGFMFASESRTDLPDGVGGVFWYGMDNPYTNFFIPLYTSISDLPAAYASGSMEAFSRDSAWWTFNFVANFANLRYSDMIQDIQTVQREIEDLEFALQPAVEGAARQLLAGDPALAAAYLTRYCVSNGQMNQERWWKLAETLIAKYNDGYVRDENGRPREVGYPEEWLRQELKENPKKFRIRSERKGEGEL
ncbi:MAG: C69 family dipeptidase [Candidatus Aminicenantes bacterium]|nr:C69 family dipeptidase [Candidatus Aminicenantes bacterium]